MSRSLLPGLIIFVLISATAGRAHAAPAEPSGAHPRLFLDDATLGSLKALAGVKGSAVARAVARCGEIQSNPKEFRHDGYMGLDWAQHLQACLISYKATGDAKAAATALVYFKALLDDLQDLGDGAGGDQAARRDSGYSIRALGPNAALAYDWLHDAPGVDAALLARARTRFRAWTDWYQESGYMNRTPAANYHAGYLFAATLIAIAEGGEAGADGTRLWRHVVDTMFGTDMAAAMAGGVLSGGDWGEGWQYAPLSVAEYALAARAMAAHGLDTAPYADWLRAILVRHVYGLTPASEEVFVGGDTDEARINLPVNGLTLAAVIAGPSAPEVKGWARAELDRLELDGKNPFLLFDVLAETEGAKATPFPRADAPSWYVARGTGTFYGRSSWSPQAVWLVSQCVSHMKVDHSHPNAGNFVLTRGKDDLVVDPSPYGSLSSLTSNAPTVENSQFPDDYKPSQSFWGEHTRFRWARQTASGILAARCDYADQYKFQENPSDVPAAERDLVVVPYGDGGDAMTVVIDRARSGDARRGLHLRFRTPAKLTLAGDVARGTVGASSIAIRRLLASGGKSAVGSITRGDCFKDGVTRGGCTAARFPVDEYRLVVPGPAMEAIHVIDAAAKGAGDLPAQLVQGAGFQAVVATRGGRTVAVVTAAGDAAMSYAVPAVANGVHVVVGGPAGGGGHATITAVKRGSDCAVTVTPSKSGGFDAGPLVFAIDDGCAVKEEPTLTTTLALGMSGSGGGNGTGTGIGPGGSAAGPGVSPAAGRGCCGAQGTSPPVAMSLFVVLGLIVVLRRRDGSP